MHVRRLLLLMEERGVDGAEPVLVSLLRHERESTRHNRPVKLLGTVLVVQVALGLVLVALVATDNLPFGDDEADGRPARRPRARRWTASTPAAAWALLREQVELGPRPAGSPASRSSRPGCAAAAARPLRGGAGRPAQRGRHVRGREPGYVVVGAHYDTKDIPGFVGANDGASGTAVVVQLARTIKRPRHTIDFIFFDGEESPRGTPDRLFEQRGPARLQGRGAALPRRAAMILLDFVGDKRLSIPREDSSTRGLWSRCAPRPARWGWRATSRTGRAARSSTTTSRSSRRASRRST